MVKGPWRIAHSSLEHPGTSFRDEMVVEADCYSKDTVVVSVVHIDVVAARKMVHSLPDGDDSTMWPSGTTVTCWWQPQRRLPPPEDGDTVDRSSGQRKLDMGDTLDWVVAVRSKHLRLG